MKAYKYTCLDGGKTAVLKSNIRALGNSKCPEQPRTCPTIVQTARVGEVPQLYSFSDKLSSELLS